LVSVGQRFIAPNEFGGLGNIMNYTYERSTDLVGGLRGKVLNDRFDWEVTLNRSDYHVRESIPSLIQSKYDAYFLGQQQGTKTIDGSDYPVYTLNQQRWWNPMSVSDFNGFMTNSINRSNSYNEGVKGLVRGDLFDVWGGPVGFAAFGEWARQGYDLNPDPRAVAGDYYVNNIDQGGGDRNRWAVGGELRIPFTSQFTASIATRYDNYDSVASQGKQTYMAGLEYRPFESLLLRGSYATSFRAPDMSYTYAQQSKSYQSFIDQYACVKAGQTGHCGGQDGPYWAFYVPVYSGGRTDLAYETGHSWTYGFVWDAFEGFSLAADYWHISLTNEIRNIDSGTMLTADAGCSFGMDASGAPYTTFSSTSGYCSYIKERIQRDASGKITAIYPGPLNQAADIFSGVDVHAQYKLQTDRFGKWTFDLKYTDVLKHLNQPTVNDPLKNVRRSDVRVITNFTTTWQIGNFETAVLLNRTGSTPSVRAGGCTPFDDGNVPSQAQGCVDTDPSSPDFGHKTQAYWGRVGPFYNVNLSVGYNFNEHLRFNFYANDLFNKVPTKDPYKFDFQYIPDRQGNPVGTELAAEVVYKF
jgi:outer membrane receptor protein involved in Fe transport